MKYTEFQRWLKKQGCTFYTREGGTSHLIVKYKDKETSFPMHGSKEIGTGLVNQSKSNWVSSNEISRQTDTGRQ